MANLIDLTGRRFGALTAVRFVSGKETKDGRAGWLCRCDCGKEKIINAYNLRRGLVTSCGCNCWRGRKQAEALLAKGAREDLTGQTFYELTALEYLHGNRWRWRCSCGRETVAKAARVKSGDIRSCGHLLSDAARKKLDDDNVLERFDGSSVSTLRPILAGKLRATNKSGCTGVRERHYSGGVVVYVATIMVRGKWIYLGQFGPYEEAVDARRAAEQKYFGRIVADYEARKGREKDDVSRL